MKRIFIFIILSLAFYIVFSCDNNNDKKGFLEGSKWKLDSYNNQLPSFEVYLLFKESYFKTYDNQDGSCYNDDSAKYLIDADEIKLWDGDGMEWEAGASFVINNDTLIIYDYYGRLCEYLYEEFRPGTYKFRKTYVNFNLFNMCY